MEHLGDKAVAEHEDEVQARVLVTLLVKTKTNLVKDGILVFLDVSP